jgi:hypothetical protein
VQLTACVAGSVLLHLGVLLSGPAAAPAPASGARGPSGRSGMAVQVAPPPRSGHSTAAPGPTAQQSTAPAASVVPAVPAVPAPPLPDPEQLPPTGAGPVAQTGTTDADYLPSRLLTRRPLPQQSIDLFYPELAPSGLFRAVLTLYIDDQGVVQRVRIDEAQDSGLPATLEDAARQTFLRSTFLPGELDGRPVRSQLRIEVEFATEPAGERTQTASR